MALAVIFFIGSFRINRDFWECADGIFLARNRHFIFPMEIFHPIKTPYPISQVYDRKSKFSLSKSQHIILFILISISNWFLYLPECWFLFISQFTFYYLFIKTLGNSQKCHWRRRISFFCKKLITFLSILVGYFLDGKTWLENVFKELLRLWGSFV